MIGYLDTSAFVPLLVAEPSSASCRRFWDAADTVVSSRLLYVETAAALAQAQRMARLTTDEHGKCLQLLDQLWLEVDVAEVDEVVVRHAADMAMRFALRGYEAVHCASAQQLVDENGDDDDVVVVVASGDQQLLTAWAELGLEIYDSNAPDVPDTGTVDDDPDTHPE